MLYTVDLIEADFNNYYNELKGFNIPFSSFFLFLYQTGCRVNEVCNFSLWTYQNEYDLIIQTSKKGNPRLINYQNMDDYFISYAHNNIFPYTYQSIRVAQYMMDTYYPRRFIFAGLKQVSTHLFRYYICKKMYSQGTSVQDISNFIGEKDNKNTEGYINKSLFIP